VFDPSSGKQLETERNIKICDGTTLARETVISTERDFIRIKLEEPAEHSLILQESILRVAGFAVSNSGVKQIDIWIDSAGPYPAHHGLMREDIGSLYEGFVNGTHAGFLWSWQLGRLEPGNHTLRLVCTAKSGATAELISSLQLDARSEAEIWTSLSQPNRNRLLHLLDKAKDLSYAPKISIITPVYKTPQAFLLKCVESVKKQVYPNWELVLVDDYSRDRQLTVLLQNFVKEDRRIRTVSLDSNKGIAGATNAGLDVCTGEYVALLDHDDEISPDALLRVVETLGHDRSLDVLYSDEDKINEQGYHTEAFFKPDWSPELLHSMNYVCHFLVCRRSLLQQIGGIRLGFDGSQDYDLILRLSEQTSKIRRIPRVLYHWRIHEKSTAASFATKPMASEAGRRALEEHLERVGKAAQVLEIGPGRYRLKYDIIGNPKIAVIIPTGGSPTLNNALESVLSVTTYSNFEIVVVDNSSGNQIQQIMAHFERPSRPITVLDCRGIPFNFSLLCNRAAAATSAEYLLFLNDDTSVITPEWIESMLELAQQPSIGAVGSLLLFPNGTIQHAGVVTGLFEIAGHPFRGLPEGPYYFALTHVIRNCSAVTGACLMTRRDVFDAVGGFDEPNLPTCFQDVDLCLKMLEKGYRVAYTPFAKLFHYESFTKKAVADLPELTYMKKRWASFIQEDPYYNPNLTKHADDYSLRYDPIFLPDKSANGNNEGIYRLSASSDAPPLQSASAKKLARFGTIQFYVAKGAAAGGPSSGAATLFWRAPGAEKVQVRVGSPMGQLFAEGSASGSAPTSAWAERGTVFYLMDATESSSGSPERVLSALQL
jgi:GT2 family glycosyltransferase